MPMDFPGMKCLKITAEIHVFRQPKQDETEEEFRKALANYVIYRDKIEAFEILFGVGWNQWTAEQKMQCCKGII